MHRVLQFAQNNPLSAAAWLLWALWLAWFVSSRKRPGDRRSVIVRLRIEDIRALLWAVGGLNLVFVLTTWGWIELYRTWPGGWERAPTIKYAAVQFSLATENTLATWYSAMVMLGASAMAMLCGALDARHRALRFRGFGVTGWMAASLLFAFLSFDEIGSFHERVDVVDSLRGLGGPSAAWDAVLMVLGLAVVATGLAWCVLQFRGAWWTLLFLALGVLLIGGVVGFESIEEELWSPGAGQTLLDKPVYFTMFEEGSELFAFWSFLAAFALHARAQIGDALDRSRAGPHASAGLALAFDLNRSTWCVLLVLSALAVAFAVVQLSGLQAMQGDNGLPQSWFASAPAAGAALWSAWLWRLSARNRAPSRTVYALVSVLCIALSAYHGANAKGWLSMGHLAAHPVYAFVHGALMAAAIVLAVLLGARAKDAWSRFGIGAWATLVVLALSGLGTQGTVGSLEVFAFLFLLPSVLSQLQHGGQATTALEPSIANA
jgi:hypothetical protein